MSTLNATPHTAAPPRRSFSPIPGVSGKQLMAGAVGNLIEWFDWMAYAFLAVYFAPLFFPKDTPALVSLLGSFGIMAVGFICRPLAGLVLGHLADRIGRKPTMLITVYGMGLASLLIAVSPTYVQIGIAAPMILLLARIIQGLCIGGEYASLAAFAMEMAPQNKRGRVAAFLYIMSGVGQLAVVGIISLLAWIMAPAAMAEWGWRLVFGFAALLSLAGVWMRRGMKETLEVDTSTPKAKRPGVFSALRTFPKQSLQVVGMVIGFTAMVYAWGAYMPAYATTATGLDPKFTMLAMLISIAASMVAAVPAGWLSDRFGRKATMAAAGVLLTVGTVPFLALLNDSVWTLILVQTFGMCVLTMLQASSMPAMAEMFSSEFRAAGLGFPYSLTVGLIGGTVPMVGTQLASMGVATLFPWYLAALMAISTVVYLCMKETAFKPLPK